MTRSWIFLIVIGLAIGLGITLFSPWASSHPDGLERVAADNGFHKDEKDAPYKVIGDYVVPGVENERLATILAGTVGVLVVVAVSLGAGLALRAVARSRDPGAAGTGEQSDGSAGGG